MSLQDQKQNTSVNKSIFFTFGQDGGSQQGTCMGVAGAVHMTGGTGTVTKRLKIMKLKLGYISATCVCSSCCIRELLVTVPFPVGGFVCLIRRVLEMKNSFEMQYVFRKQSQASPLQRHGAILLQDLVITKKLATIWNYYMS